MVISFTRVTPEELDEAEANPEGVADFLFDLYDRADRQDDPDGYLDKAWAGLQHLLDAAEAPLDLRMDGFPIGEDGLLSGWTCSEVRSAAEVLRALPFERLAAHYAPAEMTEEDVYPGVWDDGDGEEEDGEEDGGLDYLRAYYETLVGFFDSAARSDSAAIVNCSF